MELNQFYDLSKKGTLIVSAGRAGSHLMADIVTEHLAKSQSTKNLGEYFFPSVTTSQFNQKLKQLDQGTFYQILQIQDFENQLRMLRFGHDWIQNYHVILLTRNNLMLHFFGLQILHNFYNLVPVHTIKGIPDSFDSLKGKKITVAKDVVYQFLAHCELIEKFSISVKISYENFVSSVDLSKSKYLKNKYPISPSELFQNFIEVENWLYGKD